MNLIGWCIALLLGFLWGVAGYALLDNDPEIRTVEVVPEVCSDALESADELVGSAINLSDITNGYVRLIPKAFRAGVNADVPQIKRVVKRMNALTDQVIQLTASLDENEFGTLASDCLEHE
jgi:hypothetical protein